ncbi:host attachment family protein [Sphingomonas jatrophae]|uniref:Protein required for attachment to host cells n=1 Tax=Sphingomonas jatrophae TaxID=1166337 RepID=A0A1I6JHU0_9SPHN|nr:host attachment family protein [Sphingomonas jatrophae]SFR78577.1 Protein required for attachment to host cells [Sphingomonas jatrophae]
MRVPPNSLVVVADGRKLLFLRNEGDAEHPNLSVVKKTEQDNPSDYDQKTDTAGQKPGGGGPGGSTSGEADFHQLEEDRFAAHTADLLRSRALSGDFEDLIIVAPPKTLGELRKHYHVEVEKRLRGELAKDLTGHPVDDIERHLIDATL